jgi:hypothetical protein
LRVNYDIFTYFQYSQQVCAHQHRPTYQKVACDVNTPDG